MTDLNPVIAKVTDRIIERSRPRRAAYLDLMDRQREAGTNRGNLSCGNLAHGFAASGEDKPAIRSGAEMNIGIVTSYNDMLSAHQPYGRYPEQIKLFAREVGATAQVAGGVPAMCDGVTQGQAGMDLSLFSRDNIAQGTVIALSHAMFESVLLLGICDKIVPGLLIGPLASRTRKNSASANSTPRARRAATSCSKPKRRATMARAPAPFMAPPTRTR
jgi:phosphogluconate dehydratase